MLPVTSTKRAWDVAADGFGLGEGGRFAVYDAGQQIVEFMLRRDRPVFAKALVLIVDTAEVDESWGGVLAR